MPNDNILNNNVIPVVAVEFSRPVDVTLLGRKGRSFEFQVGAAERAALARRYSVVSIDRLEAQCDIIPERKGCFRLNGGFTAAVVQLCVISLETVAERVTGKFSLLLQQ
ncbi:MAG: hypothetical protein GXP02_05870, partial [Alphaproteobacteria bacterium]|nr:hypothetical protein [Alphaproteobacteria bacterium]